MKLTPTQMIKRDNALVQFIGEHKGLRNAVSSKDIEKHLNVRGFETKSACVNSLVKRIMFERRLPICSSNRKGYYWAETRTDITHTIADLESRITELQAHINHLKNFIIS